MGLSVGTGMILLANVLYLKWRLEDEPDWLRRLVAFCLGLPFTFLTFLLVECDPDMAWRRRQARLGAGDSEGTDQEFRRELELIQRRRRLGPPPEPVPLEDDGA